MDPRCDIGVVGLGVMGRNLALNLRDRGYRVAAYDTSPAALQPLAGQAGIVAGAELAALVGALGAPRAILLMVPAGPPVDDALGRLAPLLTPGDVVIDGGNSHFLDTRRREADAHARGLRFLGIGISGGEAGARSGPAIMAGGAEAGYGAVRLLLEAIAARVGDRPCCAHFGADGAGHFVKMLHNGIEYADMQLIAETVFLLRHRSGLGLEAIADLFAAWNDGPLGSFLIEITGAAPAPEAAPPVEAYRDALLGAKICAYAQGFAVLAAARDQYGWALDLGAAARVWQGGCIIRARLLRDIETAFETSPQPVNLLRVPALGARIAAALPGWRRVVADAVGAGLPVPALGSALAYLDAYRTGRLWADVIQAQRDYFGAHGFERIDRRGKFHDDWGAGA